MQNVNGTAYVEDQVMKSSGSGVEFMGMSERTISGGEGKVKSGGNITS